MDEERAREILKDRAAAGSPLMVAAQGDFRAIKRLLKQCLDAEIPSMFGPCTVGS